MKQLTRTITERPVTYTCEWCSQERTETRYPGPKPRYCPECKTEAQNALAAGRMRRMRERQEETSHAAKRLRGRPRKS